MFTVGYLIRIVLNAMSTELVTLNVGFVSFIFVECAMFTERASPILNTLKLLKMCCFESMATFDGISWCGYVLTVFS